MNIDQEQGIVAGAIRGTTGLIGNAKTTKSKGGVVGKIDGISVCAFRLNDIRWLNRDRGRLPIRRRCDIAKRDPTIGLGAEPENLRLNATTQGSIAGVVEINLEGTRGQIVAYETGSSVLVKEEILKNRWKGLEKAELRNVSLGVPESQPPANRSPVEIKAQTR